MVELQAKLDHANKDLSVKMAVLNEAQQKVEKLRNETEVMVNNKRDLEK